MHKLYKYTLLLTVIFALHACKKDDDTKKITGKWLLKSVHTIVTENDKVVADDTESDTAYLYFNDNGKGRAENSDRSTGKFTYTLKNDKLEIVPNDPRNGDKVTYNVTSLTKTELRLYNEEGFTQNGKTTKIMTDVLYSKAE